MPKCLKNYKNIDKMKAYRKRSKLKNYKKSEKYATNKCTHYTLEENEMILEHEMPDIELAKLLGRSVYNIQAHRCALKRKLKNEAELIGV